MNKSLFGHQWAGPETRAALLSTVAEENIEMFQLSNTFIWIKFDA